jgi:hypothetical protein
MCWVDYWQHPHFEMLTLGKFANYWTKVIFTLQSKVVAQNLKLTLFFLRRCESNLLSTRYKVISTKFKQVFRFIKQFSFLQLKWEPPPKCEIRIEFQTKPKFGILEELNWIWIWK